MFSESKFPTCIPILDARYKHFRSPNNNLFDPFNNELDYALAYYIAESEIIKRKIDKFLTNLLIKVITKKLSYCNADKWIKKLSTILWGIQKTKGTKHKVKLKVVITKLQDRI